MKYGQVVIFVFIFLLKIDIQAQVTSFVIDSSKFKLELLPILDSIYKSDQYFRMQLIDLSKNKADKNQFDSVLAIMKEADKSNLLKVNNIISQHGWLGPQEVGINGSQALFLVIQHADLLTQQKYIPIIREAEKKGKILSSNLAILEDRIAVREGKKQIYGSQGFTDKATGKHYIYPIIDIDNLDKRRHSMGMPSMNKYVPNWNLEEYKKILPEIEKIVKEKSPF